MIRYSRSPEARGLTNREWSPVMRFFQTDNLSVTQAADGVASLLLDVLDHSMNVFNRQVLADLDAAIDRIAGEPAVKLLVIRSGKPTGFIAGADLHEFTTVTKP